ncbi:HAD family hydrolase [Pseudomonas capsici]|uniref:2-haloalkanoic acid dehalogenase n=1 Tax=Pseudomonas capsici TaxID=2810614 RepID=A0ABT3BWB7_9PSED|nr:2-haloalkanoic acid dehalogenase [Pseudomonas capsici]MBX8607897.1 2-haloalkanoic acid dehalogenase [Pseudomonas cichorii]MBN6714872.1 2-haloalkanoic acid dehalogenase [Pseudomonas capsici]MBN6719943.1 2-haloalkanoic acid dehalogenase [Pseudomonas capsici]MBN6724393.1 2-haloalkanoic acid dehalogenase [Pseudomonas capsici]MCV4262057.1 2-haloalkanoic acid dehalogenase [Pseudomonas capsici]
MALTDYRALLIDCDEVLVDRDSGVWAALQPLLEHSTDKPDREQVLAAFAEAVSALYPRFGELGFSGLLCFAHRQLAERFGARVTWEEGMAFARSVDTWTLFEDAPGAMLYLRKFYRLLVYADRDAQDRNALCERLGLDPDSLLSLTTHPLDDTTWLAEMDLHPNETLLVSRPPAAALGNGGLCLIRRDRAEHRQPCPADLCINSMADLVAQHQLSLRR